MAIPVYSTRGPLTSDTLPRAPVENISVHLPGLTLHRRRMEVLDLEALGVHGGRPLQLVLGFELFEACVVRFDYATGVMDVWEAQRAPKAAAAPRFR